MDVLKIVSRGEPDTIKIASLFARFVRRGDVVLLDGEIGTGKTVFVKGFVSESFPVDKVTSPTFTISHFYKTMLGDILHIDLYRIDGESQFFDLGLMEYFPNSIVLVEWGDKITSYLDEYWYVRLEHDTRESRLITFSYRGQRFGSTIGEFSRCLTDAFR